MTFNHSGMFIVNVYAVRTFNHNGMFIVVFKQLGHLIIVKCL